MEDMKMPDLTLEELRGKRAFAESRRGQWIEIQADAFLALLDMLEAANRAAESMSRDLTAGGLRLEAAEAENERHRNDHFWRNEGVTWKARAEAAEATLARYETALREVAKANPRCVPVVMAYVSDVLAGS